MESLSGDTNPEEIRPINIEVRITPNANLFELIIQNTFNNIYSESEEIPIHSFQFLSAG